MHPIDHRTIRIEHQMRIEEANLNRALEPIRRANRARRIERCRAALTGISQVVQRPFRSARRIVTLVRAT